MRKALLLTAALFTMVAVGTPAKATNGTVVKSTITDPKWEKSKDGTWMGANKNWHKLNTKDASVWMSTDAGKTFNAVKDGRWQDKDGKWMMIKDKKLVWSADQG